MPRVAEKKSTPATAALTLGSEIDQLHELREKKRSLEKAVKDIEGQYALVEERLMERMGAEGLVKTTGSKATASISETVVANVEDWDALWVFILKKKLTHLLQRRVSDPAFRELLEQGKTVPGVQPFARKRLNLTALTALST